jgi:hypothetical protein
MGVVPAPHCRCPIAHSGYLIFALGSVYNPPTWNMLRNCPKAAFNEPGIM